MDNVSGNGPMGGCDTSMLKGLAVIAAAIVALIILLRRHPEQG